MRFRIAAGLTAVLLAASSAAAKPLPGGVTATEVAQALKAVGFETATSKDGAGDPMITVTGRGAPFRVYFFGCERERCTSYQMALVLKPKEKPTYANVNSWNEERRFGRAFLDGDMNPNLHMDVDAEKGFTSDALAVHLETWIRMAPNFEGYFGR